MRNLQYILFLIIALQLLACGNKGGDHSSHEATTDDSNQILYNQIMDIHDEVMPKTENLYNISKQLKDNLKDATTDAEKELLQTQINYFDSVNMMMMDWMHEFKPLPDTTNQEAARSYYKIHLEKVKRVREAILTAVDKGKN